MRIFVRYNRDGEILSVSRIEAMPENLNQPYTNLSEGESVLEIPSQGEFLTLDAIQIHDLYKVDVEKKELVR